MYVYDGYDYGFNNAPSPWAIVYGTSVGTPCWAGRRPSSPTSFGPREGWGRWMGRPRRCRGSMLCPQAIFTISQAAATTAIPPARVTPDLHLTGLGSPIANKPRRPWPTTACGHRRWCSRRSRPMASRERRWLRCRLPSSTPMASLIRKTTPSVTLTVATGPSGKINGTLDSAGRERRGDVQRPLVTQAGTYALAAANSVVGSLGVSTPAVSPSAWRRRRNWHSRRSRLRAAPDGRSQQ